MPAEELLEFGDEPVELEFQEEGEALEFIEVDAKAKPGAKNRKAESIFVFEAEPTVAWESKPTAPWDSDLAATVEPAPAANKKGATTLVREWHQHAPETLPQIQDSVDGIGGEPPVAGMDYETLQARVDKITKNVKSREVVVQETVTEYVEQKIAADAPRQTAGYISGPSKTQKKKPRILGLLREFKSKVTSKKSKPAKATASSEYQAQCMALTAGGAQCRNSSRDGSKYCISHKGYQPPTAKGIAKRVEGQAWDPSDKITDPSSVRGADTRPAVSRARDTFLNVRKAFTRKAAKPAKKAVTKKAGKAAKPARKSATKKGRGTAKRAAKSTAKRAGKTSRKAGRKSGNKAAQKKR